MGFENPHCENMITHITTLSSKVQSTECQCHPWGTVHWQQEGFWEAAWVNWCESRGVQIWPHQGKHSSTFDVLRRFQEKPECINFFISFQGVLQGWSAGYSWGDARWQAGNPGHNDSGSLPWIRNEEGVCEDDGEEASWRFYIILFCKNTIQTIVLEWWIIVFLIFTNFLP